MSIVKAIRDFKLALNQRDIHIRQIVVSDKSFDKLEKELSEYVYTYTEDNQKPLCTQIFGIIIRKDL